jgi:hypothetical protein
MGTNRDHVIGLLQSRLEAMEARFGGVQRGVQRRNVSRYDPRSKQQLAAGGMQGGDRMTVHGYSAHYAQHLLPFQRERNLVIVELGILFPKARRVIGLDVDTSHYREHKGTLEQLGAFKRRRPEVHAFDELAPEAPQRLRDILNGDKVDIFIHDALHYDAAIVATLAHVYPHMRRKFRLFVEDNHTVGAQLGQTYGARCAVERHGRLTVLWGDA